jgi:hypothetical protein
MKKNKKILTGLHFLIITFEEKCDFMEKQEPNNV